MVPRDDPLGQLALWTRAEPADGTIGVPRFLAIITIDSGLQPGGVIHAVDRTRIDSVESLRQVLRGIKAGEPVAIQIERQGKIAYLSFKMEYR